MKISKESLIGLILLVNRRLATFSHSRLIELCSETKVSNRKTS